LFVGAIAELCDTIEILHFVHPDYFARTDPKSIAAAQRDFWGAAVNIEFVPTNARKRHPLELGLAPLLLKYRWDFSPYIGQTQIAGLKARISSGPDFIFVHRLQLMNSISQVDRKLPPVFFDLDDVEHRVKSRAALMSPSWRKKATNFIQVPAIMAAEARATRLAKRTFVCSEYDRLQLRMLGMGSNVTVVPNAVDIPRRDPALPLDRTILFLGYYEYPPNIEAAERLISRIWPLIRQQVESARLIIAGNLPERVPAYHLRPANVEFTGFVDDLEALYARSRVICCPITNGGGTRVKLIEAAAHAKPIVATAIGAEGLSFENKHEILICNTDSEIAETCSRLLTDDAMCLRLGKNAYHKACSHYEPGSIKRNIAQHFVESLNQAPVSF
jgi:glycosyltransferase involved in cell wall biosynthesis